MISSRRLFSFMALWASGVVPVAGRVRGAGVVPRIPTLDAGGYRMGGGLATIYRGETIVPADIDTAFLPQRRAGS